MNAMQEVCFRNVIAPVTVGTTAVSGTFDRQGYDYATIVCHQATEATNSPVLTCTLGFGTASNSFTLDTKFTLGDTTNCEAIAAPAGTSTPDFLIEYVDLRNRGRFAAFSLGNTQARTVAVSVILSRARALLQTDAGRGALQTVIA